MPDLDLEVMGDCRGSGLGNFPQTCSMMDISHCAVRPSCRWEHVR